MTDTPKRSASLRCIGSSTSQRICGRFVRPLDPAEHNEVVVEPTTDPLARNIPAEHVHRGGVVPFATLGDTRSVLRTRLAYGEQSVAAVRPHGDGAVVTLGQVPDPGLQPDPDPLATVRGPATRRARHRDRGLRPARRDGLAARESE